MGQLDVQFPQAARVLLHAEPTLTRGPKTSTSLPLEGPHAVRVRRELNSDIQIHSPVPYLYATVSDLCYVGKPYFSKFDNTLKYLLCIKS